MSLLSIVLPSYNEELMIPRTVTKLTQVLANAEFDYELVFVDDGSKDRTWKIIEDEAKKDSRILGIHFSRNFGKEAAIMAGLYASKGDCCVVIDCDLQHPPIKILEMYELWKQGFEIIEGQKTSRGKESVIHSFAAHIFYRIISKATDFDMENASDFKLLDRKAVNALLNMREKYAFFRALSSWIGFETATVYFDVQEREAGESKWSTRSLIRYAINNISSFSTIPMQIVTVLGVIMFIIACIFGGISLAQKIAGVAQAGFTTVILLQLFSGSIIMISLGIIGFYIARIYEEIKDRPRYIISKSCGMVSPRIYKNE